MDSVRLSVKAIIITDGRLLAVKCRDDEGDWFMLPGGGQSFGETIHEALARECLEEVGCEINIGPLRFVRDYIAKNHEFADTSEEFHQVELWFECNVLGQSVEPTVPDTMQVGIEWLEMDKLTQYRLYPKILHEVLGAEASGPVVYLGDVN